MADTTETEVMKRERDELIQLELRLAALSLQARRLADDCGLSRRAIALQMGNLSPSNLQRLLKGMAGKASVETLARFAWACGQDLQVAFVPRVPQGASHSVCFEQSQKAPPSEVAHTDAAVRSTHLSPPQTSDCCDVIDIEVRRREYAQNAGKWAQKSSLLQRQTASVALGG